MEPYLTFLASNCPSFNVQFQLSQGSIFTVWLPQMQIFLSIVFNPLFPKEILLECLINIVTKHTWSLCIATCNPFPTMEKRGRCVTRSHFARWQVMDVFIQYQHQYQYQSEPKWRKAEWQSPTSPWKGIAWYSQDTLNMTHVMVITCYKFVFDHLVSLLSPLMMAYIMYHSSNITLSMQRLLQWCNWLSAILMTPPWWWFKHRSVSRHRVSDDLLCLLLDWSYAGHIWKVLCI
jgi:hypothetical protein